MMPKAVLAPDSSRPSLPRIVILGARIEGRTRAMAEQLGLRMRRFPAWLAWPRVPLRLLADFRSRLTVHVDWSRAWFSYGRGARRAARDWSA